LDAISFVYWLQGALEVGQLKELNEAQVKIVQDHLNLVLKKVTPQYNVPQMPKLGITPGIRSFDQIAPSPHDAVC
jgi:hypothetical protein